jgi:uncharacterized membrane protein (UPF0127 family)
MRWLAGGLAAVVVATVAAALLAVAPSGDDAGRLELDGKPFQPELALTGAARSRGLMFRKRAPRDGMLFVYSLPTTAGFWMRNTRVPLAIVFFDRRGGRVQRLAMQPCLRDPCRIYRARRSYSFALELPVDDARPARRLGPPKELARLVGEADY